MPNLVKLEYNHIDFYVVISQYRLLQRAFTLFDNVQSVSRKLINVNLFEKLLPFLAVAILEQLLLQGGQYLQGMWIFANAYCRDMHLANL